MLSARPPDGSTNAQYRTPRTGGRSRQPGSMHASTASLVMKLSMSLLNCASHSLAPDDRVPLQRLVHHLRRHRRVHHPRVALPHQNPPVLRVIPPVRLPQRPAARSRGCSRIEASTPAPSPTPAESPRSPPCPDSRSPRSAKTPARPRAPPRSCTRAPSCKFAACTSIVTRPSSSMLQLSLCPPFLNNSGFSSAHSSMNAPMYLTITRPCFRSHAMIMIVACSPGENTAASP